nr:kinetochore protein SLK19-like [Maniola hyperantus]
MLKRFLVLSLLTQRILISSEPEVNEETENTRATRQLNFGDCCPCPGQDSFQDSSANSLIDTISVTDDTSGPCRVTSDSEAASSIFRPSFRAAQPNIRPVSKKEEPKPLLNPEVDLASSVLETLREVTDQEYQEALVRDAARSVLQFMDPELPKPEQRNVVNIIVSPNDDNNGDIMSEATEMQESTCVLPSLNTNNNLDSLRLQPSTNLLKQILTPPKFSSNNILNRNRFEIDGSASSTQERMATPLKNNIMENLKTRLNLLNLTPFSNTDNRDLLTSPNILQKFYLKKNITDRILSQNKPTIDVISKSPNNVNELFATNAAGVTKIHMDPDEVPDFKKNATASFDNSSRKLKVSAGDILQNNVCTETVSEPNLSVKENSEYSDEIPSSSKVIEIKNQDIKENPNVIIQENEADKVSDMDADTNNLIPSTLESVTKPNSFPENVEEASEEITEDVVDLQFNNLETENTTRHSENIKDMESEPSMNRNIVTNLPVTVASPEFISTSEDESKIRNAYPITSKDVRDQEPLSCLTSAERDVVESKIHTLPNNIKSDIFRTLESFKKANAKIQQKLRYNVQDALQLVIANEHLHSPSQTVIEPLSEIRASSVELPQNNANTSDGKSMSTQDLQNMSDSLLELSSLKDNAETSTRSVIKEECVKDLENKPVEFEKMSYIDNVITTPTSLNENNDIVNLKNENLILNVKDQHLNHKNDKLQENLSKNNIIAKNSNPSIMKNEDNEMTAQPSNSVLNRIYQQDLDPPTLELLQRDFIVQPEDNSRPLEGIKHFFNSFRALGADRSTNDYSKSVFFDNQPLFRSSFGKTIDSSKSFSNDSIAILQMPISQFPLALKVPTQDTPNVIMVRNNLIK